MADALVIAILLIFSIGAIAKKLLKLKAVFLADILGILMYILGGGPAFTAILFFYASGEAATRIARKTRKKHETRGISNIIGNAGPAVICLLLGQFPAFFGAISAALADTLSSEIGMLSKKKPLLITNFKEVKTGTDGGITLLGTGASLIGAISIGIIYYFTFAQSLTGFVAIVFAGLIGSITDSVLGAIFERKNILNNTHVNFLASASGAIIVFLLAGFI